VPALFVLVALWLVFNTVTAYPVEAVAGIVLMALGLPFYFYFRASGWLTRARMKERPH
jgi:APA family basic amino acid/polyamine antiporter